MCENGEREKKRRKKKKEKKKEEKKKKKKKLKKRNPVILPATVFLQIIQITFMKHSKKQCTVNYYLFIKTLLKYVFNVLY